MRLLLIILELVKKILSMDLFMKKQFIIRVVNFFIVLKIKHFEKICYTFFKMNQVSNTFKTFKATISVCQSVLKNVVTNSF